MGSDNKRLHEDEDDGNEREEGANVQPLDVLCMEQVLESMGADKFEPRVVAQLLEFVHRYVTEILVDAQEYSMFADKQTIDPDDIRLAIASRLNHHYAQAPPRELMMELADKRNSIPLPPISNEYGVRLPPLQYQLVTKESDRQDLSWCDFVYSWRTKGRTRLVSGMQQDLELDFRTQLDRLSTRRWRVRATKGLLAARYP